MPMRCATTRWSWRSPSRWMWSRRRQGSRAHGGRFKEEVLARKQRESGRPPLSGAEAACRPGVGRCLSDQDSVGLSGEWIGPWRMASVSRSFVIVGIPAKNSASTSRAKSGTGSGRPMHRKGFTGAGSGTAWARGWLVVRIRNLGPSALPMAVSGSVTGLGVGWPKSANWAGRGLVASYQEKDRSDNPKFYVTGKSTWEGKHLLQRRRRRWRVETA